MRYNIKFYNNNKLIEQYDANNLTVVAKYLRRTAVVTSLVINDVVIKVDSLGDDFNSFTLDKLVR